MQYIVFEEGDIVRLKGTDMEGTITNPHYGDKYVTVRFPFCGNKEPYGNNILRTALAKIAPKYTLDDIRHGDKVTYRIVNSFVSAYAPGNLRVEIATYRSDWSHDWMTAHGKEGEGKITPNDIIFKIERPMAYKTVKPQQRIADGDLPF